MSENLPARIPPLKEGVVIPPGEVPVEFCFCPRCLVLRNAGRISEEESTITEEAADKMRAWIDQDLFNSVLRGGYRSQSSEGVQQEIPRPPRTVEEELRMAAAFALLPIPLAPFFTLYKD